MFSEKKLENKLSAKTQCKANSLREQYFTEPLTDFSGSDFPLTSQGKSNAKEHQTELIKHLSP